MKKSEVSSEPDSKKGKRLQVGEEDKPDWKTFSIEVKKLEEDGVYPLKKRSTRFPKAKYFCRLCDYHCDTLEICKKHTADPRHQRSKMVKVLERTLNSLPDPVPAQYEAVTELLEQIISAHSTVSENIERRLLIKTELEEDLQELVPGVKLVVSGSTLSGFALKSSDLNLDIEVPEDVNVASALLAVKKIVECDKERFANINNNLLTSYPSVLFTHRASGVVVRVGISCPAAVNTNRLFFYYSELDPRVIPLVMAFKHWAKLCSVSNQMEGSLSSHCFPLLAIHFLQQISPPVLPVLHELYKKSPGGPDMYCIPDEIDPPWKSKNNCSLGELWVRLFRFYVIEFKSSLHVINIRHKEPFSRTESRWGKKLAIEDPFQAKRNMTHTVSSSLVFDFIANNFRATYKYFAVPQLSFGHLFVSLPRKKKKLFQASSTPVEAPNSDGEDKGNESFPLENEMLNGVGEDHECEDTESKEKGDDIDEETGDDIDEETALKDLIEKVSISPSSQEELQHETNGVIEEKKPAAEAKEQIEDLNGINITDIKESLGVVSKDTADRLMNQLTKDMLKYSFNKTIFTGGESFPMYCTTCQQNGHTKSTCIEDELPPLKPLPPLRRSYIDLLTRMFHDLKNECSPTSHELWQRDYIVMELQRYISQFFPGAVLKLFGSSANGFGFGNSDLDICLTFQGRPTGEGIDHIKVIEKIADNMKQFRECRQVLAITTAKVPIVKFSLRRAQLEADLSLYNTLALQNTRLLSSYTVVDIRVQILGYLAKYFAKTCDIGDASRGSLSSYAYILMVLHFLQQSNPPVIPVLQKLYDHKKRPPKLLIDGWNAWFFDELNTLPKVWPGFRKNTQTIGELWIDFLRYYTETFQWKENVVTIRQTEPLTKLEKLWTTRCIAIEDPFDLGHNLGGGLSRNMNFFILKAFIKGRELFGSGYERPPKGYFSLGTFLFDRDLLTDGAPPNDRGCRWCGRIGHLVKDCPRKLQQKDKSQNNDQRATSRNPPQKQSKPTGEPVPPPPADTSQKPQSAGAGAKQPHDISAVNPTPAGGGTSGKKETREMAKGIRHTVVIDGLCEPPFGVLSSFVRCNLSCDFLIRRGFRVATRSFFERLFKDVQGLVLVEVCKGRQAKDPAVIIYDKYSSMSTRLLNHYLLRIDSVMEAVLRYLKEMGAFSSTDERAFASSRKTEILNFEDEVNKLLKENEVSNLQNPPKKKKKKKGAEWKQGPVAAPTETTVLSQPVYSGGSKKKLNNSLRTEMWLLKQKEKKLKKSNPKAAALPVLELSAITSTCDSSAKNKRKPKLPKAKKSVPKLPLTTPSNSSAEQVSSRPSSGKFLQLNVKLLQNSQTNGTNAADSPSGSRFKTKVFSRSGCVPKALSGPSTSNSASQSPVTTTRGQNVAAPSEGNHVPPPSLVPQS